MVTIGECAEALDRLRQKYGYGYSPPMSIIIEEAEHGLD